MTRCSLSHLIPAKVYSEKPGLLGSVSVSGGSSDVWPFRNDYLCYFKNGFLLGAQLTDQLCRLHMARVQFTNPICFGYIPETEKGRMQKERDFSGLKMI